MDLIYIIIHHPRTLCVGAYAYLEKMHSVNVSSRTISWPQLLDLTTLSNYSPSFSAFVFRNRALSFSLVLLHIRQSPDAQESSCGYENEP